MVRTPTVLTRRTDGRTRGGFQTRPRSAFTVYEVDPSVAVRTSIEQLMTAILSQRAWGTRAGLKPAPTSFATAMCFPSGVCGTLVICDCPATRGEGAGLSCGSAVPPLQRRQQY